MMQKSETGLAPHQFDDSIFAFLPKGDEPQDQFAVTKGATPGLDAEAEALQLTTVSQSDCQGHYSALSPDSRN